MGLGHDDDFDVMEELDLRLDELKGMLEELELQLKKYSKQPTPIMQAYMWQKENSQYIG